MPSEIPTEILDLVSRAHGRDVSKGLYPPQKEALKAGVLQGKNLVLCTGTGSGKTLVAELAAIRTVLAGKKVAYITPLRALSGEKFEHFRKYSPAVRVSLSMGGLDEKDAWLGSSDIIFLTTEKLDAIMRHGADWVEKIGLLVIDEIHELGSDRGPALESVIVKVRKLANPQLLALSATVGNAKEMADWLGARLVESGFRPVPLKEGVSHGTTLLFGAGKNLERKKLKGEGVEGVVADCLAGGNQALVFLSTRRSAEKAAEDLCGITKGGDAAVLARLAEEISEALPSPTAQCERLAECVRAGSAFHHAGLVHAQKVLVEDAFRKGIIRALAATVTLVAGMNLPARRIVIKGMSTWGDDGPEAWPVSLYKQAVGRAGRPGLDTVGESVVIARSEAEAELIFEKYVNGEAEEVYSCIGAAPVLRREILGAIASGFAPTTAALLDFFGSTFYAHQFGDISRIRSMILEVLRELEGWGFTKVSWSAGAPAGGFSELGRILKPAGSEEITLTRIGRRIAELYLDPMTAHGILESLAAGEADQFGRLLLVTNTYEMRPGASVRAREEESIWARVASAKLYSKQPEPWELDAGKFARAAKLACALEEWIAEISDRDIMEKYSIAPGDLRNRLVNADWVCYSAAELASLAGKRKEASELAKLRIRLAHGIREELLELIMLPGIGRARARKLFAAGLKKPEAVLNSSRQRLTALLGEKLAEKLLARSR